MVIAVVQSFHSALRRGKIVDGRVQKIFKERALLEQAFIKDTSKTVADHIKAQVATIGENIQVGAFCPRNHTVSPSTLLLCVLGVRTRPEMVDGQALRVLQVRRFGRYMLGEGIKKKQEDFAAEIAAATGQA